MPSMWVHVYKDAFNTLVWPLVSSQTLTISGTAANMTVYSGDTAAKVRTFTDTNCHYIIGESVVATTAHPPREAGTDRVDTILPGQRVSVITRA